jgi:hypothetical protein
VDHAAGLQLVAGEATRGDGGDLYPDAETAAEGLLHGGRVEAARRVQHAKVEIRQAVGATIATREEIDPRQVEWAAQIELPRTVQSPVSVGSCRVNAIRPGTGITAYLRVQNDGTYRDRFILRGTASNPNADIRYFRGQTNISSAVKSGNYRSPYLSPGGAHTIRLVVAARPTASFGAEIRVNLTARSGGQSTKRDRVSAIVEVLRPPPPPPTQHCDPNYSPCVPIASDVDCAGGSGNGPAYVEGPVRVIGNDIYDLDSDGDGIGCE